MLLRNLSIGYTSSAPIVSAIEAELICAHFTCLLGRNGSGKSTLLRTLAGLHSPLYGQILTPHSSLPTTDSSLLTSLVTPHCPDLNHTTVRELVSYGRLPFTGLFGGFSANDLSAADRAIEKVGIESLAHKYINTLSDGERQKALIARALVQDTPILLLDEPSAFLDYPSRRSLMQLLVSLSHDEGKTILLSTHDVELATAFADHLWVIKDHTLIEIDPKDFQTEDL